MLPKVFFSSKNIAYFEPSDDILRIRNHGTHTKNGEPQEGFEKLNFNIEECRKIIDFFKVSIEKHKDWKNFGFKFSNTNSYNSIDEFYREVEGQGYNISYHNISDESINELVNQGKIYLFQIYNKDFSAFSKGKPNLHTLYWKELFSEENLKNVVYKLNGQAEIFFRKKSLNYSEETLKKGHHYEILKDKFAYPIISKKRYAFDKFQFHVPITLNFKAKGRDSINQTVLDYLKETPKNDIHIIGIDRGERHLLYLSLIDSDGNIKKQYSLNDIVNEYQGKNYTTSYHALLADKETKRDESRKTWKTIETIKELKEGYVSQVVHQVAKLMVEHKAILVMEDLNFGFKKGRFKVEKQVYQKFEKMLIEKLNYYVDKNKENTELGGTLKALQLTSKFTSFKEMGKQSGFIFYVPAWNTSKIDPTTGFVNYFYTKYENVDKSKAFFEKFKSIRFNTKAQYFEFEVEKYSAFNPKAEGTQEKWTICSQGDRIITYRNPEKNSSWDSKSVVLTQLFEDFFGKNQIVYGNGSCIKSQIAAKEDKSFFEELLNLFKLTLQMRNSVTGTDEDYLISPVMKAEGAFYDSRKADETLPKDADANGAYHIAKKGLMWLDQIKAFEGKDWKKLDLDKSNRGWLNYVQS
jgi:CRISPR-associated protein Cpf1